MSMAWRSGVGWGLVLCVVLGLAVLWAMQSGAVPVSLSAAWDAGSGQQYVLWYLRVPRVLLALLAGAALGLCGALTQGLFRNPLADPGLLGVSSGASCAAALTIVLLSSSAVSALLAHWPLLHLLLLPLAAFVGALAVCFLLEMVARVLQWDAVAGLLLTGIAVNALVGAVIGLCTYLATDAELRSLNFWMLGSVAGANWWLVGTLASFLVIALWRLPRLLRNLNALALGETAAQQCGVAVRTLRTRIIVMVALLCGFVAAWCGIIGFIGLVAPHMGRLLLGADQRRLAPVSMGLGALLLLIADTLARTLAVPAELPVGIFTALFGAPFFMLLLLGPGFMPRFEVARYASAGARLIRRGTQRPTKSQHGLPRRQPGAGTGAA